MPLRDLSKYDLEVWLDKSSTMDLNDCGPKQNRNRWDYLKETALGFVQEGTKFDQDGVTIAVFNRKFRVYENTVPSTLSVVFQEQSPIGGTFLAPLLTNRLDNFFAQVKTTNFKPRLIVILTDGRAEDEDEVRNALVDATRRLVAAGLGRDALGFSFVQVGHDKDATKFLDELNNDLHDSEHQKAALDIINSLSIDEVEDLSVREVLEKALTE